MTLADLPHRRRARVQSVAAAGELTVQLMELGLVPGAVVEVLRRAPLGDPLDVDVAGARLAIRRAVAQTVAVTDGDEVTS